jgi:hypothetical protein
MEPASRRESKLNRRPAGFYSPRRSEATTSTRVARAHNSPDDRPRPSHCTSASYRTVPRPDRVSAALVGDVWVEHDLTIVALGDSQVGESSRTAVRTAGGVDHLAIADQSTGVHWLVRPSATLTWRHCGHTWSGSNGLLGSVQYGTNSTPHAACTLRVAIEYTPWWVSPSPVVRRCHTSRGCPATTIESSFSELGSRSGYTSGSDYSQAQRERRATPSHRTLRRTSPPPRLPRRATVDVAESRARQPSRSVSVPGAAW